VLDIGGSVGALVVTMPRELAHVEIEIRSSPGPPAPMPVRHVAVVRRPTAKGHVHSAVFDALPGGRYELYVRPDGSVALSVEVRPGEVTFARWPGS
jgi:hypothetical protein